MLDRLYAYARQHRPEGILHGMTDQDIEDEAGWDEESGRPLPETLRQLGLEDL